MEIGTIPFVSCSHHTPTPLSNKETQSATDHTHTHTHSFIPAKMESPVKRMGSYEVGPVLGSGEFSKVYLATHSNSKKYALKVLGKRHFQDEDKKEKFHQEMDVLAECKHPNILSFYECVEDSQQVGLVLEFCPLGDVLDFYIKYGLVPPTISSFWMKEIISAIEYCHNHGFIHRDLKLENFMLGDGFHIKVADFGYVARIHPSELGVRYLKACCGSPAYAAPEILTLQINSAVPISTKSSHLVDEHSPGMGYLGPPVDVWSLGICFYAMRYGSLPFDHPDPRVLCSMIKTGKYQFPQRHDLVDRDLITTMLDVNPKSRPSANHILAHPFFENVSQEMFQNDLASFLRKKLKLVIKNGCLRKYEENVSTSLANDDGDEVNATEFVENTSLLSSKHAPNTDRIFEEILDYVVLDLVDYIYIEKVPISSFILFRSIFHLIPTSKDVSSAKMLNMEHGFDFLDKMINSFDVAKQLKSTSDDYVGYLLSTLIVLSHWVSQFYKEIITTEKITEDDERKERITSFLDNIDDLIVSVFDSFLRPFSDQIADTLKQNITTKNIDPAVEELDIVVDVFGQLKDLLCRHDTLYDLGSYIWIDMISSVDAAVFNSLLRASAYSCGMGLKLKFAVLSMENWLVRHVGQTYRIKACLTLLRELADALTLPKETLLSEKAEQNGFCEVCPSLSINQLHYILEHYKQDVYDEEGVPLVVQSGFRRLSTHDVVLPFWTDLVVKPPSLTRALTFRAKTQEKQETADSPGKLVTFASPFFPIDIPFRLVKEGYEFLNENGHPSP